MKYKNAAIVCAAAGCLFILLAVVCGGAVRWCAMAAAWACLGYLAVQYAHCAADMDTLRRQSSEKMLHPLGRKLADTLEKREISQREAYTAAVSSSQSKINALQNQINPHFLYNTLECIRSEAIIQGCDNIAHMSNALASFFRYSISRRENIVTLRDELNNIRNYFLIQQFRFEDRFFLDIELDEENTAVQECLLPKMTIQPIVENSIFHGLEPKPGQGHVKIRVRSTENLLHLVITDDGIGMDAETLARMRANMERKYAETNADRTAGHGNGIAMHNVNQRIKLIFGPEYGVQIYSSDGQGTQVEVLVPIIRSREEMQDAEGILL